MGRERNKGKDSLKKLCMWISALNDANRDKLEALNCSNGYHVGISLSEGEYKEVTI